MLAVADSIVTHHNVDVPAGLGMPGRDGLLYSYWYPLQSFLAVPLVALAAKASSVLHLPSHYVESVAVTVLPALYTALTVPAAYLLALSLGSDESGGFLAAITFGFGTMALAYTRDFYADPLLALLFASGILLAFMSDAHPIIILVTALAVLAKPTGIVLGPVLSAYLLWKTRRLWVSLAPSLGSAMGLAVYFLYNFARFGNALTFGQPLNFSIRFIPAGVARLLFSPGEGLVWFCPCVVLSVVGFLQVKARRLEAWTIGAVAAAYLLLLCCYPDVGFAGWAWGPRHLLPILPGLVALTGVLSAGWRKVLVLFALLGFLLTAPNLVSYYGRYYEEAREQGVSNADLMWRPSRSPLLHQWPAAYREIQDARHVDVRQLLAQRTDTPGASISTSRALRIVAVWWWLLPVVHVPRLWGALASALLTLSGIWLLLIVRSRSGREKMFPVTMVALEVPRPR